ncbi:MAG: hypothetical protein ABIM89_10535 [Mycobacteriales bacterium]
MTATATNVDTAIDSSWQRTARLGIGADAAASGALSLLLLASASGLDSALGIGYPVLLGLAAVLMAWAVELGWTLRRLFISPAALRGVIAFNAIWVVASAVVVAAGWDGRTALGTAFVVFQALAATGFTLIQVKAFMASGGPHRLG